MRPGEAVAGVSRQGDRLTERLVETIDPAHGGFGRAHPTVSDAAAFQLLWRHYMVTGSEPVGDAVVRALRAICRSELVDEMGGGTRPGKTLSERAQLLELLTWVWRHCRCPELGRSAEGIATCAAGRMRRPGLGFTVRTDGDDPHVGFPYGANGLMLVALVEAGSVFERRDWLSTARTAFDEVSARLSDDAMVLEDYATLNKAAIRLFEAFGKPRYLELAETWVARLDQEFWDAERGGYRATAIDPGSATPRLRTVADAALPSGNAVMIGVLARLHALTGAPRYAGRAEQLVEAFHQLIAQAGMAAATAFANVQTLAQLVSIKVSGDPKSRETRALMRIALDYALPDRLVLGPGAGDPTDRLSKAQICLGARRLAPMTDVSRLLAATAPGGLSKLAKACSHLEAC